MEPTFFFSLGAKDGDPSTPLVVRVALFPAEQATVRDYQGFVQDHLFPTLRTVPGYVGTYLGRQEASRQLVSISFWESEAAAMAGEQAVGRAIAALPPASAPRPARVDKYVIEYRDVLSAMDK